MYFYSFLSSSASASVTCPSLLAPVNLVQDSDEWYDPVPALPVKQVWEDNHLTTNPLEAQAALNHTVQIENLNRPSCCSKLHFFFFTFSRHFNSNWLEEAIKTNKRGMISKCYDTVHKVFFKIFYIINKKNTSRMEKE